MKVKPVVFFTINEYDSLGVGYMVSTLSEAGYSVTVIDPRKRQSSILKTLKANDPLLVGFSIIFLNYIELFQKLASYLRRAGINCHFTAGGHYASLRPEQLFESIPELDSILRFEGELPVVELVKCVDSGNEWKGIENLVYRDRGKIIKNKVRAVETDIDKFPFPYRNSLREYAFKKKFTSILASRGCLNNCSFCNTWKYYKLAAGPVKRIRKPEMVVKEIDYLYHEKGCSIFFFHDDDFPLRKYKGSEWIKRFCYGLDNSGLGKKIMWKINCRPDEVEEESFSLMKNNGLFMVFIGIEDSTDAGLTGLNKKSTAKENLRAIEILRKLRIDFDYGFMLFQPSTTFDLLKNNLNYLKSICNDGYTPVTFLKLLPLYETPIEEELRESGRLLIRDGDEDYDFPEQNMNSYYAFIKDCFDQWMISHNGIENLAKCARNYIAVYKHYYPCRKDTIRHIRKIKGIISKSNLFFIDTMEDLANIFESGIHLKNKSNLLGSYSRKIQLKTELFRSKLLMSMAGFLDIA
jgi:anaerobic magnesium-protoporphyrin IX monomethyl ester cyclase